MLVAERPPPWLRTAPCKGAPVDAFVPDISVPVHGVGRRVPDVVGELCPGCPVRTQCLSYGRATGSTGWWGGHLLLRGKSLRCLPGLRSYSLSTPSAASTTPPN
jgi:hypothetical protein